jgi:endonuclease/exonuclease/phosphatase (EEP) superfamily protein YafD
MPGLLAAIAAALVTPLSFAGAALGLAGLAGRRSGWLDVIAHFAPVWLALSLAGAALAWPILGHEGWRGAGLIAALVGVAANGLLVVPELMQGCRPGPIGETAAPLRVLTFNIWSENPDQAGTVEAILQSGADIIALQEIRTLKPDQRARLAVAYPHWIVSVADGGDLALLSMRPWTASNPRLPAEGGRLAMAWGETSAPDGRPVQLLTTHFRHPMPPAPQAAQRAALARAVGALAAADLILTGDFNLAPWSAALRRQDRALTPLIRRTRALFTWPARMARPRHQPLFPVLAIDHLYAGPAWRTLAVARLRRTGSDHYGVLATLARAPTSARP